MTIQSKAITAIIITCFYAIPALATESKCPSGEESKWMPKDDIKKALTAQGYEVRKIEEEDGCYEAYALKDGKKFEIYINPTTGAVVDNEED